jgi:hypothetical protein
MSYVRKETVVVTTDSSGAATAYTQQLNGRVLAIVYTKTDFDNGVDFTLTNNATGQSIWSQSNVTASATVAPRQPAHGQDGAALLYAAGGAPVTEYLYLADEPVKIVIAQGGNVKTGSFTVVYG